MAVLRHVSARRVLKLTGQTIPGLTRAFTKCAEPMHICVSYQRDAAIVLFAHVFGLVSPTFAASP